MRSRLSLVLVTEVVGTLVMAASGPRAQRPEPPKQKPGRPLQCAPPATQRLYAPLPAVGWGEAELVLNNNSANPMVVYSTFFRNGTAYQGAAVTLAPSEVRWTRLSELAGTPGRGLRGYEGVELAYEGILMEVGAQLTLLRPRGGTVDLPFSMAGDYRSTEQQAVWPAPPGRARSSCSGTLRHRRIVERIPATVCPFSST